MPRATAALGRRRSTRSTPTSGRRGTRRGSGTGTKGWEDALPTFEQGEEIATRQAMAKVLGAVPRPTSPGIVSGAADLTGNTGVKLPDDAGQQTAENPGGRQVYYGIREHAHGRGARRHGHARRRPAAQAARSSCSSTTCARPCAWRRCQRAKVVFVFSHDSVGVGEDGPTHQPVEHLATLRAIPGLQVIRPADANETAAAWRAAVDHDGPTVLVLTRQGVPVCTDGSAVERGAGIVRDADGDPALVIVATGSEVAAGHRRRRAARPPTASPTRVVSLPSWDRFAAQGAEYRDELLPAGRAGAVGRGGHDVRLGALRRRLDRHRPLRRQRARRRGARPARHQRRPRGASGPRRS